MNGMLNLRHGKLLHSKGGRHLGSWESSVFFLTWQSWPIRRERKCHDLALSSGSLGFKTENEYVHEWNVPSVPIIMTKCKASVWPHTPWGEQDWQVSHTCPVESDHSRSLVQMWSFSSYATVEAMIPSVSDASILLLFPLSNNHLSTSPCSALCPSEADLFELYLPCWLLPEVEGWEKKMIWPSSLVYLKSVKGALARLGLMLPKIVHSWREVQAVLLWILLFSLMASMAYCDITTVTLLNEMYSETLWLFISTMAHMYYPSGF